MDKLNFGDIVLLKFPFTDTKTFKKNTNDFYKFDWLTALDFTLEKYVQVDAGTIVMPNLTIKEGSVTGSMTFVNKSLEAWGIYMGVPATFKKERKKALLKFVEL